MAVAVRPRHWLLGLLGLALGIMITSTLRASAEERSPLVEPRKLYGATVERLERENRDLKEHVGRLRATLNTLQRAAAASEKSLLQGIAAEIDAQWAIGGLTPVVGPGVRVTLNDAPPEKAPPGTRPERLVVQAYDIRDVVLTLWEHGAEAIAVNGERLVATSSIYAVGPAVLVNDSPVSPPYRIEAIGPAEQMRRGVETSPRLARLRRAASLYGIGLAVEPVSELQVNAYQGTLTFRYAEPLSDLGT
jgi:uncharacterized protein YlxW (UPF0749 family)